MKNEMITLFQNQVSLSCFFLVITLKNQEISSEIPISYLYQKAIQIFNQNMCKDTQITTLIKSSLDSTLNCSYPELQLPILIKQNLLKWKKLINLPSNTQNQIQNKIKQKLSPLQETQNSINFNNNSTLVTSLNNTLLQTTNTKKHKSKNTTPQQKQLINEIDIKNMQNLLNFNINLNNNSSKKKDTNQKNIKDQQSKQNPLTTPFASENPKKSLQNQIDSQKSSLHNFNPVQEGDKENVISQPINYSINEDENEEQEDNQFNHNINNINLSQKQKQKNKYKFQISENNESDSDPITPSDLQYLQQKDFSLHQNLEFEVDQQANRSTFNYSNFNQNNSRSLSSLTIQNQPRNSSKISGEHLAAKTQISYLNL
ncbi:hypothetical protein PPERSA_02760 [Pseudocohnilembus persalinus]|uniref:Uncharacterized protein n=1 Tax=Pseudocohnilembus persalinus TaxID=266149 RepID=A0A0V0Q9A7_PSEPJ|nr:hypothetical protein PPERSA_02760 [Pseudocohnilembus persalinus]|eukprot:KRW98612.1 hypothetical protein PPERSA_02760 [Pseudocohnilembus persalinus]